MNLGIVDVPASPQPHHLDRSVPVPVPGPPLDLHLCHPQESVEFALIASPWQSSALMNWPLGVPWGKWRLGRRGR